MSITGTISQSSSDDGIDEFTDGSTELIDPTTITEKIKLLENDFLDNLGSITQTPGSIPHFTSQRGVPVVPIDADLNNFEKFYKEHAPILTQASPIDVHASCAAPCNGIRGNLEDLLNAFILDHMEYARAGWSSLNFEEYFKFVDAKLNELNQWLDGKPFATVGHSKVQTKGKASVKNAQCQTMMPGLITQGTETIAYGRRALSIQTDHVCGIDKEVQTKGILVMNGFAQTDHVGTAEKAAQTLGRSLSMTYTESSDTNMEFSDGISSIAMSECALNDMSTSSEFKRWPSNGSDLLKIYRTPSLISATDQLSYQSTKCVNAESVDETCLNDTIASLNAISGDISLELGSSFLSETEHEPTPQSNFTMRTEQKGLPKDKCTRDAQSMVLTQSDQLNASPKTVNSHRVNITSAMHNTCTIESKNLCNNNTHTDQLPPTKNVIQALKRRSSEDIFSDDYVEATPDTLLGFELNSQTLPESENFRSLPQIERHAPLERKENAANFTVQIGDNRKSINARRNCASFSLRPERKRHSLNDIQECSPVRVARRSLVNRKCTPLKTNSQSNMLKFLSPVAKPDKPCVTCTRLNKEQMQMVATLSNRKLISYKANFTPSVTHLIVACDEDNCIKNHTMKLLQAIANRLWVLSIKWVEDSLQAGTLVPEAEYEAKDRSGVEGPRLSRLNGCNSPLLKGYKIHVAPPLVFTTRDEVETLIKQLGGKVAARPEDLMDKENFICLVITESKESPGSDTLYEVWQEILKVVTVDLEWLSRSLGQFRLLSLRSFMLCSDDNVEQLGGYPQHLLDYEDSTLNSYCTPFSHV